MELLKIFDNNGSNAVSARELYIFLGLDLKNWKRWYTKNIINNEFAIENEDYESLVIERSEIKGNFAKDFALRIPFAKKLSMQSKTQKGEDARNYFLDCETKYKSKTLKEKDNSNSLSEYGDDPFIKLRIFQIEQQKDIDQLKNQVNNIIEEKEKAKSDLKQLPFETVVKDLEPELTTKDKIRMMVNKYAATYSINQSDVWNKIYNTLYYNYHISIKGYKKKASESYLSVAERKGFIDKLFLITCNLINQN